MEKVVMFVVESIAISALLYLLYRALFKGKASYFAQRAFLLLIPAIATISALVSFDFIELRGWGGAIIEEIVADDSLPQNQGVVQSEISTEGFRVVRSEGDGFGVQDFMRYVWGAISLVLLSAFVWRLSKIVSLRRIAAAEQHADYTIYRLWSKDVIFSFWRDIYIGADLQGDKLDFVLRHELEHIRRCHYVDKLLAELYAIFLWFNPIVRLIQRDLSLIHEFEADHAVVEGGCNVKAYKMFIFEEVSSPVPTFANGINSSQIKKRFITMDKNYQVSHKVLRTLVTLVTFIFIVATSVVYVEAKVPESPKDDALQQIAPEDIESVSVDKEKNLITVVKKDGTTVSFNPEEEPAKVEIAGSEPAKFIRIDTKPKAAPSVDARRDQIYVTPRGRSTEVRVVRCEDHTKVYIGGAIRWDTHWFAISKETYLIDPESGDKYMVHCSGTGLPLDKVIWVKGQNGKCVYFELIFPPLDKDVKRVNFTEWAKAETTRGYAGGHSADGIGWNIRNIKVEKKLPDFVSKGYQAEQDIKPRVIKMDDNFVLD